MYYKIAITIILLFCGSLMAQADLGYVELNTENMDQLDFEIEKLNLSGFRVVHIFPPNAVLVRPGKLNQDIASDNESIVNYLPPRKNQAEEAYKIGHNTLLKSACLMGSSTR